MFDVVQNQQSCEEWCKYIYYFREDSDTLLYENILDKSKQKTLADNKLTFFQMTNFKTGPN